MKRLFVSILIVLLFDTTYAQTSAEDAHLDSLITCLNHCNGDMDKLKLLKQITLEHYNVDSTIKYSLQSIELSKKLSKPEYEEFACECISWSLLNKYDFDNSIDYSYRAIIIADSLKDNDMLAKNYFNLAVTFSKIQDWQKSDEYYHKALELFVKTNDYNWQGNTLRHIGTNNYSNQMYKEAVEVFQKAILLDKKHNNNKALSEDYLEIGNANMQEYENNKILGQKKSNILKAKINFFKAYKYACIDDYAFSKININCKICEAIVKQCDIYNIGGAKKKMEIDTCHKYLSEAYNYLDKSDYKTFRYDVDFSFIKVKILEGKYNEAKQFMDSLAVLFSSDSDTYKECQMNLYYDYEYYYTKLKDYEKAYYYKSLIYEKTLNNRQLGYAISATQNMAQHDFNNKLRQNEIVQKQKEERQKNITHSILIILGIVICLGMFITKLFVKSRRLNKILDSRNAELQIQKKEIETQRESLVRQNVVISKKNKEITDSIKYGSLIQKAVLPKDELLNEMFREHFIIYKPVSIVAGDFYWAGIVGKYKMIVAADSSGHGVPGAFISMLGMSMLNDLSQKFLESFSAADILNKLRQKMIDILHQEPSIESNHGGIDMALVVYDSENKKIHFAGAFRPLLIIRDGKVLRFNPNRMPIGIYIIHDDFTEQIIDIEENDLMIINSDGIIDQFGYDDENPKDHPTKFNPGRYLQLLEDNSRKTLPEIKEAIYQSVIKWKKNEKQLDDWLVIGFRF